MNQRFLLLLLLAGSVSHSYAQNNSLVGTWKMVSGKSVRNDSTFNRNMDSTESMKIVTPTHFAVFAKRVNSGELIVALAGPVRINGDKYIEEITYATNPDALQRTATYTYKVEGDRWYIDGWFGKSRYTEEWQRVK